MYHSKKTYFFILTKNVHKNTIPILSIRLFTNKYGRLTFRKNIPKHECE